MIFISNVVFRRQFVDSPWERYTDAGTEAYQQRQYAEAEKQFLAALQEAQKLGPEDPRVGTSLNNLGVLYKTQGKYAEAEPLYQRALAIREKTLGPDNPNLIVNLNNLAMLYEAQGKYAEAEPLYQRALAIDEKAVTLDGLGLVPDLNNLAVLYDAQGKYAEAEALYQRALAILEKRLGPGNANVAERFRKRIYAEAEAQYKRALAIREKALGPDDPLVAQSLENYAALLRKIGGREEEAAKMEARAKAIRAKHAQ